MSQTARSAWVSTAMYHIMAAKLECRPLTLLSKFECQFQELEQQEAKNNNNYRTTAQHVLANQLWTSKWAIHSARWGPSLFLLSLRLSLSISISFDLTQLAVAWCIKMCQHSKSAVGLRQAAVLLCFPPCPSPPMLGTWSSNAAHFKLLQSRALMVRACESKCAVSSILQHAATIYMNHHEPSLTVMNHILARKGPPWRKHARDPATTGAWS